MVRFSFAGYEVAAIGGGALWWPARRALIVADLHFEKGSWFARHGQFLPPYDSLATLADLGALVSAWQPRELWCLGDSFHDAQGCARLPAAAQATLRALTGAMRWTWVTGNHDIGVGAAKTYKIHDPFEFEHYLRDKLPCEYILEEFISGEIVTFDGLTDKDGRILFTSSLRYSAGVMDVVNQDGDIYYYSARNISPALEAAGRAAVSAFQVCERFFHLEFFECSDGRIVALEANIRPPGGLTVDMFNFAFDFDVYREWANVFVTGKFSAPVTRKYAVGYVGRKHHLSYKLSHEQALECAGGMLCHHEGIMGVFAKAIGNYGYILRSSDEAALIECAEAMLEKR